jgi:VanZ family protein
VRILRFISLWGPVAAFMVVVFSLAGSSGLPDVEESWHPLIHAVAYLVFGILCLRATHGGLARLRPGPTVAALALAAGYAALDEWHQTVLPGREASVADWIADVAGIAVACGAVGLMFRHRAGGKP